MRTVASPGESSPPAAPARRRRPRSPAEYLGFATFLVALGLLPIAPGLTVYPLTFFVLTCLVMPFLPNYSFFFPIISRGRTDHPFVSLTFDDGPDPVSTPPLLRILNTHRITATFFVTGEKVHRYPELIKKIIAAGHSIGNHSYSHDDFIMFRREATLVKEIELTQLALGRHGVQPLLFRPPVGIATPRYAEALHQTGLAAVTFRRRPKDLGNRRIHGLAKKILTGLKPGDIILLHDIAPRNPTDLHSWFQELQHLLQDLQKRGLKAVPLEKLIERPIMKMH